MEFDLVITNGKLVIPPDIISSSIGIKGEKIAAIAIDLSGFPAKKTIDARGNYVLPSRGPKSPGRAPFSGRRFYLKPRPPSPGSDDLGNDADQLTISRSFKPVKDVRTASL
jgi:hypothetical protein